MAGKLTSGTLLPAGSADARCLTAAWTADVEVAGLPLSTAVFRVCMVLDRPMNVHDAWPDPDAGEARSAAATCFRSDR